MWDFFEFRRMLTPTLVQIAFVLGLTLIGGASIFLILDRKFFAALVLLLIGPFVLRIYLETLVVMFRIHSELVAIADRVEDIWVDSERES